MGNMGRVPFGTFVSVFLFCSIVFLQSRFNASLENVSLSKMQPSRNLLQQRWTESGCVEFVKGDLPLELPWNYLQDLYASITGNRSTITTERVTNGDYYNGLLEVKRGSKGRGLYAKIAIKEGTMVYSDDYTGFFSNAVDYLKFVDTLPRDLRCQTLMWAYCGDGWVGFDLNPNSLMNHSPDPNVLHGRSIRDIEAGEELGEDYGSFTTTECWESMGFGIWKEDTFGFTTKK
mmetsp:Transcript_9608/g.19540  ORF Transcript_9608/g.19540 Transcript_9608/m.19540 type:complete len:232 (-) Transcript_9608:70-765(-)